MTAASLKSVSADLMKVQTPHMNVSHNSLILVPIDGVRASNDILVNAERETMKLRENEQWYLE